MRTETFTADDITCTIRSRTGRTSIIEGQYTTALRSAFPSAEEYQVALYSIARPRPLDEDKVPTQAQQDRFDSLMSDYTAKVSSLRIKHIVGARYADAIGTVAAILSRVTAISNAPFHLETNGLFSDASVVVALNHWLDFFDTTDTAGFWSVIIAKLNELDSPQTGPELKPPQHLTEAETNDPLSEPQEEFDRTSLSATSTK